jgi:hypothetical protein
MWVHCFEEDTEAGAVYRPDDSGIPLSRRPRERFAIEPGGAARLFLPGPDDRFVEQAATWTDEADGLVIRSRDRGAELRIVHRSAMRLVVKVSRTDPAR